MGGGGGKGGGGTTSQTVQIPPEVLARYNAVNAKAEEVAATPFQPYTGEFVAPLNATQQAGINATSNASQMAQPFYQSATDATKSGMQNVGKLTAEQIQQYQNPYTQAVVDPTVRALQQQQGQQLSEQQGQAIRSGAFGGDRSGLARATLQGQQNLALGQAIAPLYQQGYNTAVQTAMGQQGVVAADLARQLTGGQQLGNLGSAAQNAALTGAQAQIAAGTLPQQTQQAEDTAKYQQFMQEKGYPFQTTQFLANIAEGTGALSGNTTTQTQGGGFFSSDARLKENIEPIGELFDGQKVYRYNFKDDKHKTTQIGLIAQEAAREKKPGVGVDDDGFLAVNYHDVTDDAAEAGKGLVPNSMGGAVRSAGAFARGGYATDGGVDFGSLVAAHAKLYEEGKKKEAGLGIPSAPSAPKSLQVAPMLSKKEQPNAMEQAMKMGQGVAQTGEAIKKMSNWKPIEALKEKFGSSTGDKLTTRVGAENPNAKGLPGAQNPNAAGVPGKGASMEPTGGKGLVPQGGETKLSLGPDLGPNAESFNRPASTGVMPQRYADSGQTMNDAGRQYNPVADANGNVDAKYAGQAIDVPRPEGVGNVYSGPVVEGAPSTAAQPPLQDIQEQNQSFQGLGGSSEDFTDTANESLNGMGSDGMDFASSLDSLGDFADYGSDMMDVADYGDMADFGDAMAFAKRGGRIHSYAKGGLVPRQHYAGAGFVTPGYDTEHNPTDIMDQTLDQQEEESKDDASQFNAMKPKGGGGGGGGGGGDGGLGTALTIAKIGMMAFSDARLKKNIEPVGKTYDGQNIYRYDFGDGKTQLGLIAQEVAKHKPEAVGKKNGYLTVDYKHATKDASPFAYGGLVPREHHAGPDETNDNSNVAGDGGLSVIEQAPRFSREDLSAEVEPTGLDTRLVAMAPDKPFKIQPMNLEDMPEHRQALIRDIYQRESGNKYNVRQGTGKETFDIEGSHPGRTPAPGGKSSASGAGQFIYDTWNDVTGGAPMTKGYQDAATWQLAQRDYGRRTGRDLDVDLKENGITPEIQKVLAPTWAAYAKGEAAPRPPKDVGPPREAAPERGLGSFLSGKSGKGKYSGVDSENASLGDVVREYTPSGVPTSEDFWMPALGFLGGMLSSPNPKLLGAIGSGLVSGVSTQFEMDKLNQERAKNAFAMLKDRFEDAIGTDANGNSIPMKRDTRDGKLYSPEQMGAIQAQLLKSFGVTNPAAYGLKGSTAGSNAAPAAATTTVAPSAATTATTAAQAQPQPGETKVAENLPPGITKEQAANPVVQQAVNTYPPPPPDMQKHEMSQAQLEANAFWNWKKEGLAQDPMPILHEIQRLKNEQAAWSRMGASNVGKTTALQADIKSYQDRLDSMLGKATGMDVKANEKMRTNQVERADKYADLAADRTGKLNKMIKDIDTLAYLQSADLSSGVGAGSLNQARSLYQFYTGKELVPTMFKSPAAEYEYAVKMAASRVAESIKEIGGQRAPGVTSALEGKIAPDPEKLTPGAIHLLLGSAKGDALYNLERDTDFEKNHRYDDPAQHPRKFSEKPDEYKGFKGQDKYNRKIAEAYSSLPVPTQDPGIGTVVTNLNEQLGKYGYKPMTKSDGTAAAANAQNAKALEWANSPANANDPRAKQIKQRLGVQ